MDDALSKGRVMPKLYISSNEESLELKADMKKHKSNISLSLDTFTADMMLNMLSEPGKLDCIWFRKY